MSTSKERIDVLHVDDEPDFAEMAAQFLKRHDDRFDVETVTSASDAIDKLVENEYDCVVSDFDMPRRDGIDFLQNVREDYPDLPFILYTGKGSEAIASEAISAGVTDYLQKESGTSQYEVLANRIRNVVGQFHTRKELDRSKDLLEHTEQLADVGGWEGDVETGEQRWTEGTYEIHDIDPDSDFDPTVDAGVSFYHPDDRDEIERVVERCMKKGEPFDVELRLITANDRLCWVRSTGEPVRKDGDIVTIRGAIRDITESKERERELSEEKEKYSTLVEQSHDGILVLQNGEIKFANEQAENILDFEEAELLGKSMLSIVDPKDRERLQDRYQRRLDSETESPPAQYDMQFLRKDGEQRHANISAAKIQFDGEPADLVTFRDITERKEREQQMMEMKERYQTLVELAPDPVFVANAETGEIIETNAAAESVMGESREQIVGRNQRTLHPPEDADLYRDAFENHETDERISRLQDGSRPELMTADGDTVPIEISATSVSLPDGPVKFAIMRDISEQVERN